MYIPKKNRDVICTELFTEGVLVSKKEYGKHMKLDVTNLEVINLMRTFKALKYVEEQFCWRHFYWVLTPAGIDYLRELLHLKANVFPNTQKATARDAQEGGQGPRQPRGGPREGGRGRGYGGAARE